MAKDKLLEEAMNPATQSAAYQKMTPKWDMIETLLGGTEAMREASTRYLPMHMMEDQAQYKERLERATLFNVMELTLDSLVGRPFFVPAKLSDGTPEDFQDWAKDVDARGTSLNSFLRGWFRESFAKGFTSVLVDMPVLTEEQRKGRTLADDKKERRRPYLSLVKPENVIFASSGIVNGVEVLTHVRIMETVVTRVGFAEVSTVQIRVLEPGTWAIYKQIVDPKTQKVKWAKSEEGVTDMKDRIPLVTYYVTRSGLMECKPPLEDLAYMNVEHWQSKADQTSILTVARFPILAVAGASESKGDNIGIGPRQLMSTRDANGRFYYVEHSGAAIQAGSDDLKGLEERMSAYGAQFLRQRGDRMTGTERKMDSSETMSPLRDAVIRFNDAANDVLALVETWMGKEPGKITVEINKDYTDSDAGGANTQALAEARRLGDISHETYLKALQDMDILSDEVNIKEEVARVEKEKKEKEEAAQRTLELQAKLKAQNAPKAAPPGKGSEEEDNESDSEEGKQ